MPIVVEVFSNEPYADETTLYINENRLEPSEAIKNADDSSDSSDQKAPKRRW